MLIHRVTIKMLHFHQRFLRVFAVIFAAVRQNHGDGFTSLLLLLQKSYLEWAIGSWLSLPSGVTVIQAEKPDIRL